MTRTSREFRYAVTRSPLGPITVVEGERGVVAVDFGETPEPALRERLEATCGGSVVLERRARLRATTEIGEYFRGRRRGFGVRVDLGRTNAFQRRVLECLARVGFGELTTYGALAARVGKPGAARAVGAAMARNPVPILVPCHRVVASDGSLGGFSGGLEVKRRLQEHEGIGALPGGWPARGTRRRRR